MGFFDRFKRGDEVSPGGSEIYRHTEARQPGTTPADAILIEAIEAHIEKHIAEPEFVWHQLLSPYVHVDIHIVPPAEERPWITLVTSGMSQRAMNAPPELGTDVTRAELVMALPPDWPTGQDAMKDERNHWPFRLLQMLAALPHEYDTWLWIGHTIPNGDPPAAYADGTDLCCAMLFGAETAGEDFVQMRTGDHVVTFLGVFPIYDDEMRLKLEAGTDELARRLDEAGITELVDPTRPSVA